MNDPYVEMRAALPTSYVNYIEAHNGWEGFLPGAETYLVLWDKEAIQENYAGYEMHNEPASRWFAFGSNGGGGMLCFDLASRTDAVYMRPFIGMSDEQATLMHKSFGDLARRIQSPSSGVEG
jgi:hypothetical protein